MTSAPPAIYYHIVFQPRDAALPLGMVAIWRTYLLFPARTNKSALESLCPPVTIGYSGYSGIETVLRADLTL